MSQIINWLTSFRLHLDYAETRVKRQYGKTSDQVKAFKAQTHQAFDSSIGYRFISKFRNYVQHCGPPITSVSVGLNSNQHQNPFIKQTATFLIGRDAILLTQRRR